MCKSASLNKKATKVLSDKGFTLIELLVVIAIIGLLSTLAIVALNIARGKSRDTKRVADMKQVQKALELFYADNLSYPTVAAPVALGTGTVLSLCGSGFAATCAGTNYMVSLPQAPSIVESGCTAGNNAYSYSSGATSGVSATYAITFCLGSRVGELGAGLRTASQNGMQ